MFVVLVFFILFLFLMRLKKPSATYLLLLCLTLTACDDPPASAGQGEQSQPVEESMAALAPSEGSEDPSSASSAKPALSRDEGDQLLSQTPDVPADLDYLEINGNVPYFSDEDISSTQAYVAIGDFDALGRVSQANAVLGVELMPQEERGDISSIHPTGWQQRFYTNVPGGALYNRSHLIGHQLAGDDSPENLMTGTQWFNQKAMLPFENFVAAYIESTENHVRYRMTPVFEGDNLLASGLYMEGFSIEDNGEGVSFNIYIPNRQPGVDIDYADGSSRGPQGPLEEGELQLSPKSQPTDPSLPPETYSQDLPSIDVNGDGQVTIKEAQAAGYSMPIHSDHWLYPYMHDADGDGMVGEGAG